MPNEEEGPDGVHMSTKLFGSSIDLISLVADRPIDV